MNRENDLILVIGASGYVGSRLVLRLHVAGYRVRCLARNPEKLDHQPWRKHVEVVKADVLDTPSLSAAMAGATIVYYLVHSLAAGEGFHKRDLAGARNCAKAAKANCVKRIIYLGGLGNRNAELSDHLRSRQATGDALRETGLPVTEFRAGVIVGSGSYSFELVRYLTERLPVMICPRWVKTRIQPISIQNVLDYLVAALEKPASIGQVIEIGGRNVLTYGELMKTYAGVRSLRRFWITVPLLTPRLSSYWLGLVTPLPTTVGRLLIEGLRSEVVVRSRAAAEMFPEIQLLDCRGAVAFALARGEAEQLAARPAIWALPPDKSFKISSEQGIIRETRRIQINAPSEKVYRMISQLSGKRAWPALNWAWRFRAWLDYFLGGPGLPRARTGGLRIGDPWGFWRIEALEPDRSLRLRSEIKLPGKAWLQFFVERLSEQRSELVQSAFFRPKGLAGFLYWHALYPVHRLTFRRMIRQLAQQAEA